MNGSNGEAHLPPFNCTTRSWNPSPHWKVPQAKANVVVRALPPLKIPLKPKTSADQACVEPSQTKPSMNPPPSMKTRPTVWRTNTSISEKSTGPPVHVTVPLIVADPVFELNWPVLLTVRSMAGGGGGLANWIP